MDVERGGAGDDDEPGNDIGKDGPDDDVKPRRLVLPDGDAFLDNRGLQVELHPRRDGGADDPDGHVDVGLVTPDRALGQAGGFDERVVPVRPAEHAGDDVRDVKHAGDEEDLLDLFVVALDDQRPDEHRADGHADVFADAEEADGAGDSDEFRDDVVEVDHHQQDHHDERHAQAELLADEVGEALAGDGAHARAHFLHHDQGDRDRYHGPQELVSVGGAGLRVGEDAARVVIDIGGDEAGAEDGEDDDQAHAPGL